jgi:hypothetical protein
MTAIGGITIATTDITTAAKLAPVKIGGSRHDVQPLVAMM